MNFTYFINFASTVVLYLTIHVSVGKVKGIFTNFVTFCVT